MWTIPFSLEFISLASLSYINTHTLNGTTHINKVPQASRDCNPILVEQTQPLTLIASLTFLKKLCFQQEWAHNPCGAFFHHFQAQSQLFFLSKYKGQTGFFWTPQLHLPSWKHCWALSRPIWMSFRAPGFCCALIDRSPVGLSCSHWIPTCLSQPATSESQNTAHCNTTSNDSSIKAVIIQM